MIALAWPTVVLLSVFATLWTMLRMFGSRDLVLRWGQDFARNVENNIQSFKRSLKDIGEGFERRSEGLLTKDDAEKMVENNNRLTEGMKRLEQMVEILNSKRALEVTKPPRGLRFDPKTGEPMP